VRLPALTEFLPYVSCNPLDGLADLHLSQFVSVRTFAECFDGRAVRGHGSDKVKFQSAKVDLQPLGKNWDVHA
jgi:hypothetical protein